jgi:hypothetical protein
MRYTLDLLRLTAIRHTTQVPTAVTGETRVLEMRALVLAGVMHMFVFALI